MNKLFDNIVITGYSAITAAGIEIAPIIQAHSEGSSALSSIPDKHSLQWGKASFFKASDFIPPLKARKMDRSSQLATATAGLALKNAGIDIKTIDAERIGIAMGCGFGGVSNSSEFLTGYFNSGVEGLAPMLFPNTVSNAAASNTSIEHGLKGPNVTMVQRFCSAESAFLMACRFIEEDRADIMLVGGIDELNPLIIEGLHSLGQLKTYAAGFGEGCGIIVLEKTESARKRNAKIKASVDKICTIGMLPPEFETEGCELLLGNCASITHIGLSGTVTAIPALMNRLPESSRIDIAPVVGRSLAMGATSIACLIDSIQCSEKALYLTASPEGPYYSIRFTGGLSE